MLETPPGTGQEDIPCLTVEGVGTQCSIRTKPTVLSKQLAFAPQLTPGTHLQTSAHTKQKTKASGYQAAWSHLPSETALEYCVLLRCYESAQANPPGGTHAHYTHTTQDWS